jgi:sugar diacid utilization regulator
MQTIAVNKQAYANATEATVFGPFFVEANTVRHRLRRIEKRTGRSLSRPRDVTEPTRRRGAPVIAYRRR